MLCGKNNNTKIPNSRATMAANNQYFAASCLICLDSLVLMIVSPKK